ncbi:hypothetical protein XM53_17260 [Roseovarius atlanticus]|uniref:Uncharacterized protein n=1 Tax=Roseovarius atlanticus TaxID=1641875 RepID=A0A0T5NQV1_9RHOB|nr:hypothetical protein XM53_17260 [Roseovarius atlanticus]
MRSAASCATAVLGAERSGDGDAGLITLVGSLPSLAGRGSSAKSASGAGACGKVWLFSRGCFCEFDGAAASGLERTWPWITASLLARTSGCAVPVSVRDRTSSATVTLFRDAEWEVADRDIAPETAAVLNAEM